MTISLACDSKNLNLNQETLNERTDPVLFWKKFIVALACLLTFASNTFAEKGPKIIAGPYLQHVTKTSMAIMWETDKPCTATVKFAEAKVGRKSKSRQVSLNQQVSSKKTATIHELVLENLKVQTDYFYQAYSSDAENQKVKSEILTFQTAVKDNTPFTYIVMGDNRSNPSIFKKISEQMLVKKPRFVLNAGDLVANGKKKAEWIKQYLSPAAELMKRIPTYVAIGNHEKDADWYYKYSSYPSPENYYSFDYGNAHFTIIDSNQLKKRNSKQLAWIKKDLAASRAKWKFVMHHHPPFSSDENDYGDTRFSLSARGDGKTQPLIPIYEKYGVDVVWSGHIHDYERSWPIRNGKINQADGVIYVQTGGGGAELENFAPTRSWFAAKVFRGYHYCLVSINGGNFSMKVYDIKGNVLDYFRLKK